MKERPIIFNADMVRAVLDGRKTQTRRQFKVKDPVGKLHNIASPREEIIQFDDGTFHYLSTYGLSGPYPCPFGQPGDRLWVRETHHVSHHGGVIYRADWQGMNPFNEDECGDDCSMVGEKWKPSIHMPRWASRILLEISDIRVERVQDITESDCDAEGLVPMQMNMKPKFAQLWESIYGAESWDRNDWVWVIEFKRIEPAQ